MAVDTSRDPISSDGARGGETRALFSYAASREGRTVMRLYGFASDGHKVRVAAEIYPFTFLEQSEPEWFMHDFPGRDQAELFADEAMVALECLGCTITDEGAGEAVPATTVTGRRR